MGMYTGLRCCVKLKSEFVSVVKKLIEQGGWQNLGYDFLDEFNNYSRSGFIPFGALCYMPDHWEYPESLAIWENRVEKDIWTFQCSLKNYDDTIEYFLQNVLIKIIKKSYHIEVFYEEWDEEDSQMFTLHDGTVLRQN